MASGSDLLLVCYSRDLARARRVLRRVTNAASQLPMLSACVFGEEYLIVESNLPQLTRGAARLKETALAASAVYEGLNVFPSH
ncbi:MAG: hypothetical protein CR980_02225 [Propionibacteriales bacterium]|nr:MAG: hypothetical protein CR980_02225 [Propionibacteriales bacterium]